MRATWRRRHPLGAHYITALAVCASVICLSCAANSSPRAKGVERTPTHARAVYVLDTHAVLARSAQRAELAAQWKRLRIRQVALYGLGVAIERDEDALVDWLISLRRDGIGLIAPVAGMDRLPVLTALLRRHPELKVDTLVTEFEFWNRSDRDRAFTDFQALVKAMRTTCEGRCRVGVYLGHPSADEAAWIAAAADVVYLDYSVASPARAWSHVHGRGGPLRERFLRLASAGVEVWPIFYARGEVDMAAALRRDGLDAAEARFLADARADADGRRWLDRIGGFMYFGADALP
jgi:hypothetical protein